MTDWLSLLYVGPQQFLPVAVGVILWIALAGLGCLVTPRGRVHEANAFYGWAAVSTVFTLVGVVVAHPFFVLSILAALGAVAGLALAAWRRETIFVPGAWRVLVLALPLLLIAGAMEPSQWDEFSHWLPAIRFLIENDGFPTAERTYTGFVGYPYAWPLLSYLSGRFGGEPLKNIGAQLNILMLLTFATFALRTAFAIVGRPRGERICWPFAAAIALTATVFNPTFVQKIALTAYSDVSSSVVTGVAILVSYRFMERLAGRDKNSGDTGSNVASAWELALVMALLINIRQTNVVVLGAVVLGLILVAWRDRDIRFAEFARVGMAAILLPAAVYLSWRGYIALRQNPATAEPMLYPLAQWNYSLIPQILLGMANVAVKKFAFFAPMLIACALALRALVRYRDRIDSIAILTATVFAVNIAFLFVTYLGHFGSVQAITVASFWRYNIDIGMVAVIFITTAVVWWWARRPSFDRYPRWLGPLAIILVLALPAALAKKVRFDLEPPKPHFIAVAKDMLSMGLSLARVRLLDPTGTGEAAVITRYILDSPGEAWLGAFHDTTPPSIAAFVDGVAPGDYMLVHSVVPGVSDSIGRVLDPRRSHLLKRQSSDWTVIKDWPKPTNHEW